MRNKIGEENYFNTLLQPDFEIERQRNMHFLRIVIHTQHTLKHILSKTEIGRKNNRNDAREINILVYHENNQDKVVNKQIITIQFKSYKSKVYRTFNFIK